MSTNQLFFALVTVMAIFAGFFKYYIDAKIDGVDQKAGARIDGLDQKFTAKIDGLAKQVDLLVGYMIDHESRISKLEEKTK